MTAGYTDLYGDIYLADPVTVTVCGSGAQAIPIATSSPWPACASLPVAVTNVTGDWMVAVIGWQQQDPGDGVSMCAGDDVHNYWVPLGAPFGTSDAAGTVRTSIWAAPAAKAARQVMIAPTGPYLSVAATILDVAGMAPWMGLAGITTDYANAATALTPLGAGIPSGDTIWVTGCASDLNPAYPSLTAAGWTSVPRVSATNGTDHTSDIALSAAWQIAAAGVGATWTTSTAQDLAGILTGLLITASAPAQASPGWPYTIADIAPGAGPATPPDQITWTALTPRALGATLTQGRQYNLSQLQAGQGVFTLDNPDGAVMPPGTGAYAGIDSGTPYRIRQIWAGGAWQAQFTAGGSTAGPQIDSGAVSATAGQPCSAAAWLSVSAPWTPGVTLQLQFRSSGGTLLATASSAAVTGPGPVLATAAQTAAPAGTATVHVVIAAAGTPSAGLAVYAAAPPYGGGRLVLPAAVAWTGSGGATVSILAGWQPDPRGAPVLTPYGVPFAGFFQKWPRQWDTDTLRGVTQATVTDAWGYCNGQLQPILQQEILNDEPYAYWPLTDAAGSAQAANAAAGNTTPLAVTVSKYGSGGATQVLGANSQALLGAQGTIELTSSVRAQSQAGMWQASGQPVSSVPPEGWSLVASDPSYPSFTAGITVEFWFQTTAPFQSIFPSQILNLVDSAGQGLGVLVDSGPSFGGSSNLLLTTRPCTSSNFGSGFNPTISNVNYLAAQGGLTHVAITTTRGAWTSYINGRQSNSGSWPSSPNPKPPKTFSMVVADGLAGAVPISLFSQFSSALGFYSGYLAHLAIFPRVLPADRILTHYQAGVAGMAGDTVRYRIERLLQAGESLGRRVILPDGGQGITTVASCQDIAGQAASTSIENITASTLPGQLSVSPAGELFYLSRKFAWGRPVTWVLGDAAWLGEIPVQAGQSQSYDPLRVVDDIQLTQLDNLDVVTPSGAAAAAEPAARAQYGDNTYWVTGYLEGDLTEPPSFGPGLGDLANWIATTSGRPQLRYDSITVDAASHPAAWQFVSQAAVGDVVVINLRPPTSTEVITVTGTISQTARALKWSLDGTAATLTCLIDSAPELTVLTADDPVLGQLNGVNVLAW